MIDLKTIIQKRQSCRNFAGGTVSREAIDTCLEAACLAPSACNAQPWRFVVVDDPQHVAKVSKYVQDSGMNRFAEGCSAFVVIVEGSQNLPARVGSGLKNQKYSSIDIGIATAHFVLAATEQDIATCILGWFNEWGLKTLLNIPKMRRIRLVIAMGTAAPDDPLRNKVRKPAKEVISYNRY